MSSIKVDGISMSFQNLLAKICFHHHFSGKASDVAGRWGGYTRARSALCPPPPTGRPGPQPAPSVTVVERVDSCASMYSRSIQGHHVCLLLKKVSPGPPSPVLSRPQGFLGFGVSLSSARLFR